MAALTVVAVGLLSLTMVTAAPVAPDNTQEALVDLAQPDMAVERAKRADEILMFGNEQNRPRSMAKKSGPDPVKAPSDPEGEVDQGSEVIVHKEEPVPEDMKARLEAEQDDTAQQEQYHEELESAMHSIVNSVADDQKAELEQADDDNVSVEQGEATADVNEEPETEVEEGDAHSEEPQEAPKTEKAPESQKDSEETEVPEEPVTSDNTDASVADDADDAEKDLQVVSLGSQPKDTEEEGSDASATLSEDSQDSTSGEETQMGYNTMEGYNDPSNVFYNYFNMYRGYPTAPDYPQGNMDPYFLARRRRSAAIASLAKARRNHRIKRDLIDDLYGYQGQPAEPSPSYYPQLPVSDDDYLPLSDKEAAMLYSSLLDYIEEAIENEDFQEDGDTERYDVQENDQDALMPFEPEYLPEESDQLQGELPYLPDSVYSSLYENGYPYGPVDMDTYSRYAKRGREMGYVDPGMEEKRSFFPYADEPETHWGAFVPEKRDYDEAIQRLQRLAMALSDNPAPYGRDILEDYRKK